MVVQVVGWQARLGFDLTGRRFLRHKRFFHIVSLHPAVYKWVVSLDKARGTKVQKCNKRFIKVDSLNVQFISKLSASFIYYSLSVNFFSEIFFFLKKDIPGRTLFIIYQRNKIYDAKYLVFDDRRYITVRRHFHIG